MKEEEEVVHLTPEPLEELDKGIESLRTGKLYTGEEAAEFARQKTREWIQATKKHRSA